MLCAAVHPADAGWFGGGAKGDAAAADTGAAEGPGSRQECRVAEHLPTPAQLKKEMPAPADALATVKSARDKIQMLLDAGDNRVLVVVGPCSIHDPVEALAYAAKLSLLAKELDNELIIVMRTYFEKPRTRLGWKGFVNDPLKDRSFDVAAGLKRAREVLIDINKLGLPCATEFLDPLVAPYIADLISYGSTGARTVDSQIHREMTSGLGMPVGVKHDVYGHHDEGMNALLAAAQPHVHLGLSDDGVVSRITTTGNKHAHLVLRGGGELSATGFRGVCVCVCVCARACVLMCVFVCVCFYTAMIWVHVLSSHTNPGFNYDERTIQDASARLSVFNLCKKVVVDCSHGNMGVPKDLKLTVAAIKDLMNQVSGCACALVCVCLSIHLSMNLSIRPSSNLSMNLL